jgi:hypothetical protein
MLRVPYYVLCNERVIFLTAASVGAPTRDTRSQKHGTKVAVLEQRRSMCSSASIIIAPPLSVPLFIPYRFDRQMQAAPLARC